MSKSRAVRIEGVPVILLRSAIAVAAVAVIAMVGGCTSAAPTPTGSPLPGPSQVTPSASPSSSPSPSASAAFDKKARSIDDPASIWVVVNKQRPLNPINYVPADLVPVPVRYVYKPMLRKVAADAVVAMFTAAAAEGAGQLQSQSAYRSYDTQVTVYNGWVRQLGKTQADLQSARPGTSEHQTGLAIDISPYPSTCALASCFGSTPQGKWLTANAYRFGFILRYPQGKTPITGYTYEPWHYRYIGVSLATEMHRTGIATLEEFFGLPAAPDYPH